MTTFTTLTKSALLAAVLLTIVQNRCLVACLACYETEDDGTTSLVENASWRYCVVVPDMKHVKGKAFGLDPQQDSTEMYEPFFDKMDGEYKVLSICLYEQYSLPRRRGSENLLRCVCNYDLCNAATSLKAYFTALE